MTALPTETPPQPADARLLLIDAHDVSRRSSRALLDAWPGLCVVGESGDHGDALAQVARLQPDLVLMSMRVRGSGGPELTRELLARHPRLKVVFLTFFESLEYVDAALAAGAHGYVLKQAPAAEILAAIQAVMAGGRFLAPELRRPVA